MEHFKIENLSFSYPTVEEKALKNINLTIDKGEYITICGRSGSGKTTLLKHLKTPLMPHGKREGRILFNGTDVNALDLRTQASAIGYVMQNPDNQIVTDKVWHELAFGLESLGLSTPVIRQRVAEMASFFGITGWFHKNVNELSGGQKQLLNLASIMVMHPEVIICDEPTSMLDPIAAADFLATIKRINVEIGTTIIITEHRLEDVFAVSDRVCCMENGEIIALDKPEKIGELIREKKSKIFDSLPTPVKVFYGLNCKGEAPLTVREGRSFLEGKLEGKGSCGFSPDEPVELYDNPAIMTKELWYRYDKKDEDALKGATIGVPKGSFFALVGGNGTGKSTLLKAICGIVKPYQGKIYVDGKDIKKYKQGELFKNNIAMLPQDPQSLFVKKTVAEELYEMAPKAESEVKEIAEKCELTGLLERHPFDISGGEQQRLALAKVLLTKPKILLLDEPTKGMDNFFKDELAKLLKSLENITILMVSHDIEFCAKYADYIGMFFDGNVITTNTPRAFFADNGFYTTSANRMSRGILKNAITDEDIISLLG